MTTLEFFNKVFFQWFFIRLTKCQEREIIDYKITEASLTPTGMATGGIIKKYKIKQWYAIHGFIMPLSGWNKSYRYIGRGWFIRITSRKSAKFF